MREIVHVDQFIDDAHASGLTIIETIKQVRDEFGVDLAAAKRLVSSRPCWSRIVDGARRLHEEVIRIAERTSDHPEIVASTDCSEAEGAIERLAVKDVRTLFDHIHTRPGMWFTEPSFRVTAAFISGYDEGRGREPLRGFREWLIVRLKWGRNLGWESLVLRAAFPHVDAPEELLVPGSREDLLAIDMLFELFAEFDDVRSSPGGLARILEAHEAYV